MTGVADAIIAPLEREIRRLREINALLLGTLLRAHDHLEYCNYGDPYESECARDEGLPTMIANTIAEAKKAAD